MAFTSTSGTPYVPDSFAGDYGWNDNQVIDYFASGDQSFQGNLNSYMQGSGKSNQDLLDMINHYAPDSGYDVEKVGAYTGLPNDTGGGGLTGGFDVPDDLSPIRSGQQNQSTTKSTGHTGIDFDNPFVKSIMPSLTENTAGLMDIANNMTSVVQNKYDNLMREGLGPNAFQGTMNQYGAKNMLNSSVTGDAISKLAHQIMTDIGNKGYDSMLAGEAAKMEVPGIQAGIVDQIGRETDTASDTVTSGSSFTQDPYEPYRNIANIITNQ